LPAFKVMKDATLHAIASEIPRDEDALLAIPGVGPTFMRKYAAEILAITTRS
jgi:superfamily II DNA helicase RecQ